LRFGSNEFFNLVKNAKVVTRFFFSNGLHGLSNSLFIEKTADEAGSEEFPRTAFCFLGYLHVRGGFVADVVDVGPRSATAATVYAASSFNVSSVKRF
jgi:hypothetical protein